MSSLTLFQYCQKLVVLSRDGSKVLLAKRKGEADYDDVYSFIGGKMETSDESLLAGMKREKDEEIGSRAKLKVWPEETYNVLFRKKDGTSVVLPHIAAIFAAGDIELNEEYSDYKWVSVEELVAFSPKIENITSITKWAKQKMAVLNDSQLVEI